METAEFGTNTNPNTMNNLLLINSKIKKNPHNITIKNYNPNEPKTKQSKILYSDKQNYRKYKTKIEPKLLSRITIDEEDDLVAKIRKEFGITNIDKKKNYSEVITAETPYYKEPETSFYDISRFEKEDLTGQVDDDEEEGSPMPLTRELSRTTNFTELSELTTETGGDWNDIAERYGITFRGPKPKSKAAIEAREREIREKIAELEANRGAAKK